jgi:hypothetical protein
VKMDDLVRRLKALRKNKPKEKIAYIKKPVSLVPEIEQLQREMQ